MPTQMLTVTVFYLIRKIMILVMLNHYQPILSTISAHDHQRPIFGDNFTFETTLRNYFSAITISTIIGTTILILITINFTTISNSQDTHP